MLLFSFLLVPMVLAAPIELTTNNYVLKIDDNVLISIQITGEPSNDLNLSGLGIRGIDKKLFENLTHVKNLDLANNSLSDLPELVFSYFEGLEHLSLADNVIKIFDKGVFSGLNNLKTLNISNNPVDHLFQSNFFGIGKLTDVLMHGNSIRYMNIRLFEDPNLEDELLKMLMKEEVDKIGRYYGELIPPETDTSVLDKSLKVKVCIRRGIVASLEACKNAEDLEPDCKEVEVEQAPRKVSLRELGISKFDAGWYRLQSYPIRILDLEGNNIVDVAGILNELPEGVRYVSLAKNKIERLAKGKIINQYPIELNFANNQISEVENGAFENANLSGLTMIGNQLRNTTFVTSLSSGLQELVLSENRIDELTAESFSKLNNLLYLNLVNNNITEIKSESLRGLSSLQALELSKNNLKKIEPDSFQDLKNLGYLELYRNKLTSLDKGVFNGLQKVGMINLGMNNLTKITSDSLYGLPDTLENLNLDYNQIDTLEAGTFVNVPKVYLSLNNNKITKIEKGSFNLPTLKALSLIGNLLSQPDGDSFVGLGRLRYLDLQNNGIAKIEKGTMKNLGGLFSLAISNNPIKRLENGAFFGLPKSRGSSVDLTNVPIELVQGGVFDDL